MFKYIFLALWLYARWYGLLFFVFAFTTWLQADNAPVGLGFSVSLVAGICAAFISNFVLSIRLRECLAKYYTRKWGLEFVEVSQNSRAVIYGVTSRTYGVTVMVSMDRVPFEDTKTSAYQGIRLRRSFVELILLPKVRRGE